MTADDGGIEHNKRRGRTQREGKKEKEINWKVVYGGGRHRTA
jgi:hypothetical protein